MKFGVVSQFDSGPSNVIESEWAGTEAFRSMVSYAIQSRYVLFASGCTGWQLPVKMVLYARSVGVKELICHATALT